MKIKNIFTYRDGGTILIETDQGNYYIPQNRIPKTQLTIMKGDYFKGNAVEVTDHHELYELIKELSRGCEVYCEIKGRYFTSNQPEK